MAKRTKLSYGGAKRLFQATSDKTHVMNLNTRPMRGGTRL